MTYTEFSNKAVTVLLTPELQPLALAWTKLGWKYLFRCTRCGCAFWTWFDRPVCGGCE